MRRLILCLAASLTLHGAASQLMADGKVFPPKASAIPTVIPDQQALISWHDGVETLVIRNRLIASGEQFAWIVPVPAPAEVTAVTPGLMPTLEALFQPRVRYEFPNCVPAILFVTLCVILGLRHPYAAGLLLVAGPFVWFVGSGLLHTQSAGGGSSAMPAVTVHQRVTIDGYEVVSIGSEDPEALIKWLEENGFAVDQASRPVIASYVKDGWQFAAVRLAGVKADQEPAQAPALAFTFAATRAVYPLRLTGTQGKPINLELYVFGPQRAGLSNPRLTTRSCRRTRFSAPTNHGTWRWKEGEELLVIHPGLGKITAGTAVATHLTGRLQPKDMEDDVRFDWSPFEYKEYVVTSRNLVSGAAWNSWWLVACSALIQAVWRTEQRRATARQAGLRAAVICGGACLILWPLSALWPSVSTRVTSSWPEGDNRLFHSEIVLHDLPAGTTDEQAAADIAASRTGVTYKQDNPYTGQPRIREDSPGNWDLRQAGTEFEYLWYDGHGGEHVKPWKCEGEASP